MPPSTNSKSSSKENPKQRSRNKSTATDTQRHRQTRAPLSDHDVNPDHALHVASIEELEAELASRRDNLSSAPAAGTTSAPSAQPVQSTLPTPESDGRPKRASKVPMKQIKGQLGYDDAKWNALRDFTRTALASARLNWRLSWKAQRPDKIAMAYNAIEEAFPETTRFSGQWGVDRIAKQCWDNRKNYRSCVERPTTYRGRQAAARRAARAAADAAARTPPPFPSPNPSDSHSRSPSARPSRPHRARPLRVDSNDASGPDSNRNGLEPLSDHQDEDCQGAYDGDGPEEEEEEGAPQLSEKAAGKRRAPSQGGTQHKRQHRA